MIATGSAFNVDRPPSIAPAVLDWRDGQPVSVQFGDIYFSRDDGLAESRYVFINHNRLIQRFEALGPGQHFVVAESGFGSGLNFLATWQAWLSANPPAGTCLHFVSVERFPLQRQDLERALALWPELSGLASQLLAQYPELVTGLHRRVFAEGNVRLSLYFGEAEAAWQDMDFIADAWFLDGFAPARNPDLWSAEIAHAIAVHSRPGTTLSTFTAAGEVRRQLQDVGFEVSKVSGFGRKRVMLTGSFSPGPSPVARPDRNQEVLVIGAGIAGSLLARNLASRGRTVRVIDAAPQPATGASGNQQGALYVKLGVDFSPQTQLALSALMFAQSFYAGQTPDQWHPTGLIHLAWNEHEQDRQQRFVQRNRYPAGLVRAVSASEAEQLTGARLQSGGLWYPGAGWLEPEALCRRLLDHPHIHCNFGYKVSRLMPCNGRWHVSADNQADIVGDRVVLCAGPGTPALLPVPGGFRFKSIRGQITSLPEQMIRPPRAVICGPRYLNPASEGRCLAGASFDLHDTSPEVQAQSHRDNLDQLDRILPDLWRSERPEPEMLTGRVAFRLTTHDYQPAVGVLAKPDGRELDGIDLLTGLGSKGLAYAPLLAEYLTDRITGQPRALPIGLADRLRPQRCRMQEGE